MKTRSTVTGLCFGLTALFAAGQIPQRASLDRLDEWLTAVEQHEPGVQDEALRAATSWSRSELLGTFFHVGALVSLASDPGAPVNFRYVRGVEGTSRFVYSAGDIKRLQELGQRARGLGARSLLTRGVLLHTDAAVLAGGEEGRSSRRPNSWSGRVFVRTNDGQQVGSQELAGHLEAARALLKLLPTKPPPEAAVRVWFRATAAYLQREGQLDQAHVDAGPELFPKDPQLLLLSGALHETFATARIQQVAESARLPFGVSLGIKSTKTELELAERFFRRTLGAEAQNREARIRLGNVLGQSGRHKDAVGELQQALKAIGDDPELAYYARMFWARAMEQLGNLTQARASYEQAARLYPNAQSPRIALSQLARRTGDDAAAHDSLRRAFTAARRPDLGDDPWWRYSSHAGRDADALLAAARTALIAEGNR